jgi:hypothetical protein
MSFYLSLMLFSLLNEVYDFGEEDCDTKYHDHHMVSRVLTDY